MDKLWAPWRIKYVQSKKRKGCIFCAALKSPDESFLIFKNTHAFSMLNTFPYNNGHVLVSPKRHLKNIGQLKKDEVLDLFKMLDLTTRALERALRPDGYNIGINVSRVAGAGVTGHLHIHIVPRWQGDTNFMPVIYNTKVVPESLKELYRRLKKC